MDLEYHNAINTGGNRVRRDTIPRVQGRRYYWPDTEYQRTSGIDQLPEVKKGHITDDMDTNSEGSMSEGTLYDDDELDLGNTGGDSMENTGPSAIESLPQSISSGATTQPNSLIYCHAGSSTQEHNPSISTWPWLIARGIHKLNWRASRHNLQVDLG